MKAVLLDRFGGADELQVGETPKPEPGPGQILIAVAATSVNRPDILQREGRYPPPPGESEILGLECAGIVAATGENVAWPAVGDRVFALIGGGGYAEFAVAHAGHVLPIPDTLSFEQAACIAEASLTAYLNLFENAALENGETVLLHGGGGGVNTAAIQLVAALCPDSRIVVTASPAKLDRVAGLGADAVIDYRGTEFAAEVATLTDGRGVDVILDHIGAAGFDSNLKALAVGGRLLIIGIMQGSDVSLSLGRLMVKRQRIIGSVLRSRPIAEKSALIARFAGQVMPLFADGRIAPLIDRRFPLEQVQDAHRLMEASGHFGKIVLTMNH